jgi:hypothetical protein
MIRHLRVILILAGACALGFAAAKPNFSGEWNMNPEKSDYGSVPKPSRMIRKIEHREPDLHMTTTQSGPRGERTTELSLIINGVEQTSRVGGAEVKSVPRWDGGTLRIDSTRSIQGGEFVTREKWTLSRDGKTLTIDTHIVAPAGESDITIVFDRK